jgi:Conidiation protein 6
MSNPGNVAGGHKANLNNPNTSEESKQHSRDVLDNELQGGQMDTGTEDKNPGNVCVLPVPAYVPELVVTDTLSSAREDTRLP